MEFSYNEIRYGSLERPLYRYEVVYSPREQRTEAKPKRKVLRIVLDFFTPPERDSFPVDCFPKFRMLINTIKRS